MKYTIKLLCLILSFYSTISFSSNPPQNILIYYPHKSIPLDLLHFYHWIIIDQDNPFMDDINNLFYQKNRAKLIGYVSVGEIERHREYYNKIKKWALLKNENWDSFVADISSKGYRDFLLDEICKKIADKGFDGFFLDTLDFYMLLNKKDNNEKYKKSLINFIKSLRERYPQKIIVINRGFEIIEEVYKYIDAVVVESVFFSFDKNNTYKVVDKKDTEWLMSKLNKIKSFNIPIIVVDYSDLQNKTLCQEIVHTIYTNGFIPYVCDKFLSKVGYTKEKIIPRKIILLYDSSIPTEKNPYLTSIHRLISMPLEYLGFVPILVDINDQLPEISSAAGYAGIVSLFINNWSTPLLRWLINAKNSGLKIFFIEDIPPFDLKEFKLTTSPNRANELSPFNIIYKKNGYGFEAPLVVSYTDKLITCEKCTPLVVSQNKLGQKHIPFAITVWGGYATSNSFFNIERELWVYNPFDLFKEIFKPSFPIPDITTENGRRIVTAHIDGDGFFGKSEVDPSKTTGEVIRDQILKVYKIPHTVSIIEAETAPWGLNKKTSEQLEKVAKSLFELPYVEVASHSFSHPFKWQISNQDIQQKKTKEGMYSLPIPNYHFSLTREIMGSVKYINNRLATPQKKVKVFLWTGDCSPGNKAIRLTYNLKIFNVNGGDTTITNAQPFLSRIAPMGINFGPYFQVYAPMQNENIYTNLWTGPFWGYRNAIQTFKLTDNSIRLKPISIYYHFYSGQKYASLNALKTVYNYVTSQEINPMFLSDYAKKVLDFRETAIIKKNNGFIVKNNGYLRTLRISKDVGYPDIKNSKGVVGYTTNNNGSYYVHLDNSGDYYICFSSKQPNFRLINSNGQIKSFIKNKNSYELKLTSYVPLEAEFEVKGCEVFIDNKKKKITKNKIILKGNKSATIKAICTDKNL